MNNTFTLSQFLKKYSSEDKCLEEIKNIKYPDGIKCPKCQKVTKHYRMSKRRAYACSQCGNHIYPLAGTIFEKTTTPLTSWFYAMFLMIKTRCGVSAKQLERELGVTYKTAWRIAKQIRILMADTDNTPLDGDVEVDETFVGGKSYYRKLKKYPDKDPLDLQEKEVIMGMIKRGGKAYLKHVPNTGKWTLIKQIKDYVSPKARIITDQWPAYTNLPQFGYKHDWINHKETFVLGDIHTQNAENVWSHLKRGIYGVYRHVSRKYLQAYADEFAFRYNNRTDEGGMFNALLLQVALVKKVEPKLPF